MAHIYAEIQLISTVMCPILGLALKTAMSTAFVDNPGTARAEELQQWYVGIVETFTTTFYKLLYFCLCCLICV